jgi:ABC-type transport system involved in cytochrome c biogenesis permease subunit
MSTYPIRLTAKALVATTRRIIVAAVLALVAALLVLSPSANAAWLALPIPENPGMWEKIAFLLGSAALAKVGEAVIVVAAIGFGLYYLVSKSTNK